MTNTEEALSYLRMGLSILPLRPRDKKPNISSWTEYQARKPTEDEIRRWFSNEDQNIGIICGKVSGNLVVLDFDNQETIPFVITDMAELTSKTMVVRTGKGFHIYYRTVDPLNFKLSNLSIDVKGEGGYVVAPPSIHPSGVQYMMIGQMKIAELKTDALNYLKEMDEMYPIARIVLPWWGKEGEHRHELSLGLASFFRSRAKWPQEKTERFIQGIMRLKGDREEPEDRMRAVQDAYRKDYPYNKHLQRDLVEKLVNMLPVGAGEIWRWYDKGDKDSKSWRAYMCDSTGVYRLYHKETTDEKGSPVINDDKETIFTQPLTLADAWHAEGDEENHVKFTFFLGKMKYQGTKTEVFQEIVASGLTGINWNFIRDALSACVEFYVSTGSVTVRQSFEAIGVYESEGKFELAIGEKDVSATRGSEPWLVARAFKPYRGQIAEDLKTFARIKDFFDETTLVVMFGFSAIAPFSYAMKKDGDFFWPLVIFKGPKGTGKSAIGRLFTTYLYLNGTQEGSPADVTSDFRLLDFITGTTFPRLVDESENAKFEGQKFSIKISTTLKDAAQRQIVGSRGNIDKTKKLYSARTPLILAGNKIDLEDPALLARTIMINTNQSNKVNGDRRAQFNIDVLQRLQRGFGIELTKFIMERYQTYRALLDDIRNIKIPFNFYDARRSDFYASIYTGLRLWRDFYASFGLGFPLERFLDMGKFSDIVLKLETSNAEESKDRQSIVEFIEWMKKEADVLDSFNEMKVSEGKVPSRYHELRYMVKKDMENGAQWLYVTQSAITEYCRVNTTFQMRSLSEVADALAEFYATDRTTFYDKTAKWFEGKVMKVVKIPLSWIPLAEFGKIEEKKGPPPDPGDNLTNLTKPNHDMVSENFTDNTISPSKPNQLTAEMVHPHEVFLVENVSCNNDKNMVRRLGIVENKDNTGSNDLTKNLTKPNQWLGNDNKFLNSIDEVKQFMEHYELHGRIDRAKGMVIVEISPYSEVAHWITRKMAGLDFVPVDGADPGRIYFTYHQTGVEA